MGANQNSLLELGLYPEIDPKSLFYLGHDRTAITELSAFGTGLGIAAKTRSGASKITCEIDNKNRIEEQFISSQSFHQTPGGRVREITAKEQFKPRILESFVPTTQELYRHLPGTIHTKMDNTNSMI
jgi:hypothetical protein